MCWRREPSEYIVRRGLCSVACFAHSLSHLIKENFKHFRCQFVPTFRRGRCDDSCQLAASCRQEAAKKWREPQKKKKSEENLKKRGKKRNGLIKLKPFRACQGQLPPSTAPPCYICCFGSSCLPKPGQVAQVANREPTASHLAHLPSPWPPIPLSLSLSSKFASSNRLQLRALLDTRVLISKVFALPSCFTSSVLHIRKQRNSNNNNKSA